MLTDRERRGILWDTNAPAQTPAPKKISLRLPAALIGWVLLIALVPLAIPFLVFGAVVIKALYQRTSRY